MSPEGCGFSIREWLRVDVLGRQFPNNQDYWDGNWLRARIQMADEGSQVRFEEMCLRTNEIRGLLLGVQELLAGKREAVSLDPVESWWNVAMKRADSVGHFALRMVAELYRDLTVGCAKHSYEFTIDQTDLQILEKELTGVLREYSVIGEP